MQKKIAHILNGREKKITATETVLQALPHKDFRFANPFIVLHHIRPTRIEAGTASRIHPHPHRGFSPVTFQLQGTGYHKDNAGHEGIIQAGAVQWMFAGKGLLHSEGPSQKQLEKGGMYELVQIWVNAPAKNKLDKPFYQTAIKTDQPNILAQEGVALRLISGVYDKATGPLNSFTPVLLITGTIDKGKRIQLSATPGYWTLLYVIKGKLNINCESIQQHQLVVFEKENDEIIISAEATSQILYLSAKPLEEPVAAKDNFVMNTPEEIEQAIADAKNGNFGTLDF